MVLAQLIGIVASRKPLAVSSERTFSRNLKLDSLTSCEKSIPAYKGLSCIIIYRSLNVYAYRLLCHTEVNVLNAI
jgi:hypothetical protein